MYKPAIIILILSTMSIDGKASPGVEFLSEPGADDSTPIDDSLSRPKIDTTLYLPELKRSAAGSVLNPIDFESHLSQKPTVALFKSMLVPGLGQIGNRSYLKAAVIIGLESWFVGKAIHWGEKTSTARTKWLAETDLIIKRSLYDDFDSKRDNRNKFYWFTGLVVFVSMFDAFVDAHLSGAPSNERLSRISVEVRPEKDSGAMLSFNLNF